MNMILAAAIPIVPALISFFLPIICTHNKAKFEHTKFMEVIRIAPMTPEYFESKRVLKATVA